MSPGGETNSFLQGLYKHPLLPPRAILLWACSVSERNGPCIIIVTLMHPVTLTPRALGEHPWARALGEHPRVLGEHMHNSVPCSCQASVGPLVPLCEWPAPHHSLQASPVHCSWPLLSIIIRNTLSSLLQEDCKSVPYMESYTCLAKPCTIHNIGVCKLKLWLHHIEELCLF